MRKLVILLALATASAYGIGMGAGVFGGVALPMGDMAAKEDGSDLGMSPEFGGKVLIGVLPALDVDIAFGYHLGHKMKDWEDIAGVDEPKVTIIPITVGADYKFMFGESMGAYVGGGAGYYMEKFKIGGEIFDVTYTATFDINKPGIYVGGGFVYKFGKFAVDVNPRFNYIMNSGDYDVTVEFADGETQTGTETKDWKDMYVDVRFGVDYFFM